MRAGTVLAGPGQGPASLIHSANYILSPQQLAPRLRPYNSLHRKIPTTLRTSSLQTLLVLEEGNRNVTSQVGGLGTLLFPSLAAFPSCSPPLPLLLTTATSPHWAWHPFPSKGDFLPIVVTGKGRTCPGAPCPPAGLDKPLPHIYPLPHTGATLSSTLGTGH